MAATLTITASEEFVKRLTDGLGMLNAVERLTAAGFLFGLECCTGIDLARSGKVIYNHKPYSNLIAAAAELLEGE